MSNYPLPSTFRTHFNPNGHVESPAGSYDHDLPQYPYPYENTSFLYRQGQTNGTPIGSQPLSNSHSFRSNAQGAMIPSSRNDVNGAPYAPYGGQIQYNAFETPEYPPSPFAHGVSSDGVQPFIQPSADSNLLQNSRTLFSNLHPTTEVQSTNIGVSETVPPVLSELEDGELDDEEVGKAISRSRTSTTTPSAVLQTKRRENVDFANRESGHRVANAPNKPLPGLNQDSLATLNPQKVTTSKPQPLPTSSVSIGNSDDTKFLRTAKSTSIQRHESTNIKNQELKTVNQHPIDEKIEEAKQALRDLHSQGFGFDQIVNAGLNPGILRNLYSKIEVPVTASSDLLQRKIVKPGVVDVPTESTTGAIPIHERHPNVSQKPSDGDVLGTNTLPHLISEKSRISSQPSLAAAKNEGTLVESQASPAKSSKYSNVNPLGKASGIKASGTKILDRKEYIARMLAAKAGKPAVSVSNSVSSQTSTVTGTGANAEVRSSATTAPIIHATGLQAPSDLADIALGAQKEDSDVEAKRKAQTDLARQKIEALKLRESFQQQARSAPSNVMSNGHQTTARGVSSVAAEYPAPISQPLPNRQSSYFSPASQKPPFSIPGLFMTSDALGPANLSKPPASEGFTVSSQGTDDATFGSSHEDLGVHAVVAAELTVDKASSLPETFLDLKTALPANISTTTLSSRKRQRASDFIDSPFTKVKRPLGQQEDTSVIIDISDDEVSNDTSGDDSIKTAGSRDSLPRGPQVIVPGHGKKDPSKSLPPLTDLPQHKKSVMTPPAAQASGQSGDLNGLKSKELEIEVMNRKIAELEQRIATKAKQTTSRSHSPRTSSRVTISPPPGGASHQISNPPNLPLILSDSQSGDVARVEKKGSFTANAETIETASAERLDAVQQLEQVERAKAEAERCLAAETTLILAADPSLTLEENLQPQKAEEQSNLREGEQRSEDEEQKPVQAEEERRLEESQSREAHGEETNNHHQEEADHYLQEQQETLAQRARQGFLQEQERKSSLDEQWQARKSEIESGLPLLDAEVEKTRKRLESLQQEMESLETQLQKGIEGRHGLIEELRMLSRSREALPVPMDIDSCDIGEVSKELTSTEELPAVTKPSASVETVPNLDLIQFSGTVGGGLREVRGKDTSMRTTEDRMSDQKVEEDIMDISRSDVDEAELSLYSPKVVAEVQDTSDFDNDDENYEPPNEISITDRQERDPDAVLLSQELETAKAYLPAQTQNQPFSDLNAETLEKQTSGQRSPAAGVDTSSDEQSRRSPSRSPSPANASDLDDYEPPEPASLGNEVPRSTHLSSVDTETSFSPRQVKTNDFVAHPSSDSIPAVDQQVQRLESNRTMGHFIPYESPLKQFKSFRYHPRYLEEVSGGFRSLTYSHTINPDIPLCRYELDGVCNDDSCQSQHLRSVGLSDDKILVDLGAKPDNGSSPDEFGNGLREIIHDIRSRRIKDFNIVAGEITAYRAKFLGDSSKVLPL